MCIHSVYKVCSLVVTREEPGAGRACLAQFGNRTLLCCCRKITSGMHMSEDFKPQWHDLVE